MKLIFCPECNDIVSLRPEHRTCFCGKSSGKYVDNLNAVISGEAIPLGINNEQFESALDAIDTKEHWSALDFKAWAIRIPCKTIKRE